MIAEDILEEEDREDDTPDVHGMGGGGYGRHHGQSSTSDVFILDLGRVEAQPPSYLSFEERM